MENVRTIRLRLASPRRVCFVAVVLFLCACPVTAGIIHLRDGLTHDIDYHIKDYVYVDYQIPYMYTTVNWLDGASMGRSLRGYEHSRINIRGGSIYTLNGYGASQVDISGGSISWLASHGSSQIDISGGSFVRDLMLSDQSKIQIHGSDFAVDGQNVDYGEITSIFGGPYDNEPWRRLTGTLASGEPINNDFRIGHNARIILIPEPATIALLGLGAILLRKRKK